MVGSSHQIQLETLNVPTSLSRSSLTHLSTGIDLEEVSDGRVSQRSPGISDVGKTEHPKNGRKYDGFASAAHGNLDEFDTASLPSNWSESTVVPRRNLGFVQIVSVMINSVIGTGIFTTPGLVLSLTGSKATSLVFWAVGGVYIGLCMIVFLEYGAALPYNGGALIYLDEVFHWPKLMAAVIFSFYRILLASTSTNCRTLAVNILSLANPKTPTSELQNGLIQFIAVVVQTVVCLLLYFNRRICFIFNSSFAVFKIIVLLVLFVAGMVTIRKSNSDVGNFNQHHSGDTNLEALSAMIYIVFSYQGMANVNCIAGEIKDTKRTLKLATITAVTVITGLYMLVTFAIYSVLDFESLTNKDGKSNATMVFVELVFGSTRSKNWINVAISISAFSNILFETYTTAKVKQAIAWQRIIPFYEFFGRQDQQFDSPGGALFLHWIFSIIPLVTLSPTSDAKTFASGLYTYGYQLVMVFLGIGLFHLKKRMRLVFPNWKPIYLKNTFIFWPIVILFIGMNTLIAAIAAMPRKPNTTPRYYWPVAMLVIVIAALLYWTGLMIPQLKLGNEGQTLGSKVGFEVCVYEVGDGDIPEDMRYVMWEAKGEGSRRRVKYIISGPLNSIQEGYRCAMDLVTKYLGY